VVLLCLFFDNTAQEQKRTAKSRVKSTFFIVDILFFDFKI